MNLKTLFTKLNDISRRATEDAAALCLSERHYDVEVEHVLLQLLAIDDCDLRPIFHHFEVVTERLQAQLRTALTSFKVGNTRTPALSPLIARWIERAWVMASIEYAQDRVRTGHLLLALLDDEELRRWVLASAAELEKVHADDLRNRLQALVAGSVESDSPSTTNTPASGAGKTPALDLYTVNLTQSVREGRIDPVLERDSEVRQMIDILTRRRQNNPILTGEAGVGKTAVVEGLAQRIVEGEVPTVLRDVAIHSLDLGLLQAGAGVKGEFEQRLKSVIEETKRSLHPIILFIDEAHALIGSGGQAGQNDAANLLKPALARGELRTIAATTWAEYKKYFEKDAALARRFQVVKVEEPDEAQAVVMLRGLITKMQKHHGVTILDEALIQAVRLSSRYICGRQLPDKAVSVLDTACARVALAQSVVPAALEECISQLVRLADELALLRQEARTGADHQGRIDELVLALASAQQRFDELSQQWAVERELISVLDTNRTRLREGDTAHSLEVLKGVEAQLADVQGEHPLVHAQVDGAAVSEVIAGWTGIPLGTMLRNEIDTVQRLPQLLGERVLGQDHALEAISKRIKISRAHMEDPDKPIGVFLLLGPSGVGKTETALALADTLYGGERNLITINMSEYQEAHSVATLKGSPPGYVGYGEGGVLTEAVRRRPFSVVLLDEVEKAHPDVLELFFQVFDKGVLDDAEGRAINFRNTLILLTSNVGTEHILRTCRDVDTAPSPEQLTEDLRPVLHQTFKPAFLGRLQVVPFYPVQDAVLQRIVRLKLARIQKRFERHYQVPLHIAETVTTTLALRCTEVDSGARNIDNILTGTLMPELASCVLDRMARKSPIQYANVDVSATGDFVVHLS